jgi:hypothetical protein
VFINTSTYFGISCESDEFDLIRRIINLISSSAMRPTIKEHRGNGERLAAYFNFYVRDLPSKIGGEQRTE